MDGRVKSVNGAARHGLDPATSLDAGTYGMRGVDLVRASPDKINIADVSV
ncbi:hypothetical protein GCM10009765_74440 [Fodinicola feengrottensis]|uniref:Uncharacterized protein n=1 Tax=Fodinicola feengrottensis TaxID=435914 RepID=A0ABN2IYX9_9ACTN